MSTKNNVFLPNLLLEIPTAFASKVITDVFPPTATAAHSLSSDTDMVAFVN